MPWAARADGQHSAAFHQAVIPWGSEGWGPESSGACSLGSSRERLFLRIQLPAAAPTGLSSACSTPISACLQVIVVFVSEIAFASLSLGSTQIIQDNLFPVFRTEKTFSK